MNLEPIASRLHQQNVAIAGETLYIEFMPSEVSHGLLLRDYFGGTPIDHELPGYFKTSFMLIVRTKNKPAGTQLMEHAIKALTVKQETTWDGVTYKYMRPRALPITYAPSPGQNIELAVNMDVCFVDRSA